MAETERENIREATLEGLTAAARKGVVGRGKWLTLVELFGSPRGASRVSGSLESG